MPFIQQYMGLDTLSNVFLTFAWYFKILIILFFTVDDLRVVSSDILITSPADLVVAVTISDDGIAGEPMENFTITSQPPLVSGTFDAPFLFHDSVVNIIDSDG